MTGIDAEVAAVYRAEWGRVVAAVIRLTGDWDLAEECAQDAFAKALERWRHEGVPERPGGWLVVTARNRALDRVRRAAVEAEKLREVVRMAQPGSLAPQGIPDDRLELIFTCCHPALDQEAQVALTLRTLAGLSTAEIARAFLVPEATMTRRITRAKTSVQASGARFTLPDDREERLGAVLKVVYLIFNEGYASTTGPSLQRVELAAEGIRLARMLRRLLPDDSEVAGLLALMLLTDARRPARTGPLGELVPMAEQDRSRWIPELIEEGIELITAALPRGPVGPYQLQAAIAAVHDEASSADETDWEQIVALYEVLLQLTDNPMVALNHVVAVAMARGASEGLEMLGRVERDERIATDHRLSAVRAHLLEMSGDMAGAKTAYEEAANRTTSVPQQRYLRDRASRL